MRSFALVLATTLAACDGASPRMTDVDAGTIDAGSLPPPEHGFQIRTPVVDIAPGREVTFCYYFRAPNTTPLSIKKWASRMTTGTHHIVLYLTPTDLKDPGSLLTEQCGFGMGGTGAVWTYAAQSVDAEAVLPADDGTGLPVGQSIRAEQSGFLQMHYYNASDDVIHAHVELNGYAHDDGVQVTAAAPFITYNNRISLGSGSPTNPTSASVSGSCSVLEGSKRLNFYLLSTHSHKQSVHTYIRDGTTVVFESTSWEHPGERTWPSAPFFSFASDKLSYQCDYLNPTNRTITTGDSAELEEMCLAIGYYFPAASSAGHFCLNDARQY